MARTAATFADVFDDFVKSVGYTAASGLAATEKAMLLRHFNAGYRAAWQFDGVPWEDTWEEGELTPTSGVIAFADVDDAHVWNLWDIDPRTDTKARFMPSSSTKNGIWVGTDVTSVYGFWRPVCPQFDGTVDAAAVISLLKDAAIGYAQYEFYRASGQHQTAGQCRKDARTLCEGLAETEFSRLETMFWLKRRA